VDKIEMRRAFTGADDSPLLEAVREVFGAFRQAVVDDIVAATSADELWTSKGALENLRDLENELSAQVLAANREAAE
jgi:hypothetical protein